MHLAGKGIGDDTQDVALLRVGRSKKTNVAIGKTEDGNLVHAHQVRCPQQRAIAAQGDNEIEIRKIGFVFDARALVDSPCHLDSLARKPKLKGKTALNRLVLIVIGD